MSLQDRILLRKIKSREKTKKLRLIQLREAAKEHERQNEAEQERRNEIGNDEESLISCKRALENGGSENVITKKKRKKIKSTEEYRQQDDNEENVTQQSIEVNDGSESRKQKKKKKKIEDTEGSDSQVDNSSTDESAAEHSDQQVTLSQESRPSHTSGVLTECTFESFRGKISDNTLKAVEEMGFTKLTEIQEKAIPLLLEGKHLIGAAKTGSGKTMAFLIPAVELVYKLNYKIWHGTGAIIITPTRELAMQTFGALKELMKYHHHTYGLVMGGANRQAEADKLRKGINILVATPGRLLDHLQNTEGFLFANLICLVIDEADLILDIGFEEEMKQIINLVKRRRQTILFSATQKSKTEALASVLFEKKKPTRVEVGGIKQMPTVAELRQGYIICPTEKRMLFLLTFLDRPVMRDKKIMVFFSSCLSIKFHHDLFNYINIKVMCIHGQQKQTKRTSTFFRFSNAKSGILFCTDVAARGLDIPGVDWIVQYDPPVDLKEYVHRVGRTARGEGSSGFAMLLLRPEELNYLGYLKMEKIPLNRFEYGELRDEQKALEEMVGRNYHFNKCAKDAFKAYVRAYESHRLKTVFDVNKLDLGKVALSFGLRVPPQLDSGENNGRPRKKKHQHMGHYNTKSRVYHQRRPPKHGDNKNNFDS